MKKSTFFALGLIVVALFLANKPKVGPVDPPGWLIGARKKSTINHAHYPKELEVPYNMQNMDSLQAQHRSLCLISI